MKLLFNGLGAGIILALAIGGNALGAGELGPAANSTSTNAAEQLIVPPARTVAYQGYQLFLLNCAHCHGTDARGDEGPDLHGVLLSDKRIISLIQNGRKGQMPKFGSKLQEADCSALVAFIRTLKED